MIDPNFHTNMSKYQDVASKYTALGLEYDLEGKSVGPKSSFIKELIKLRVERASVRTSVSRREVASLIGALVFLNNRLSRLPRIPAAVHHRPARGPVRLARALRLRCPCCSELQRIAENQASDYHGHQVAPGRSILHHLPLPGGIDRLST